MNIKLPPKLHEIIEKVIKDDISRFTVSVHNPNKKGEGFLGEMCVISLEDKDTQNAFHFIVKQAFTDEIIRSSQPIRDVFLTEILFYSKVWPRLQQFQDQHLTVRIFDKFAKCFATDTEVSSEKLMFENLTYQGFKTFDKKASFDKDHMEAVFKQYGTFHAVSIAFRALHPQEFAEISKELKNQFIPLIDKKLFQTFSTHTHELSLQGLILGKDDVVMEKFKKYIEDVNDKFRSALEYKGKCPVILHGDCWSNNMMFKYDKHGSLIDLRLIDLQMSREGSAAADLAYCFYSSGSKQIFSEVNHYLELYYSSLSDSVRLFGCDPDELYPFTVFKDEWKQCCKLGLSMGLLIWKGKSTYDSDIVDFTDTTEKDDELIDKFIKVKYDEEMFREMTRDIILHMYENNYI